MSKAVRNVNKKEVIKGKTKNSTPPPHASTSKGEKVSYTSEKFPDTSNGLLQSDYDKKLFEGLNGGTPKKLPRKKSIKTNGDIKKITQKKLDGEKLEVSIDQDTVKALLENIEGAKAEMCRRSLYYFTKEFWAYASPEIPIWNWHMEYLCNELQKIGERLIKREKKISDVIINIPPGTSKSTICSIMLPAWLWANDPTLKIISGSYAASVSIDSSTRSRIIISSEKYQKYFPAVILRDDQNVKTNYATSAGGARMTTSTGAQITGFHAHLILIDDPQNVQLAHSQVERENTNEWVSSTLSTRKVDSSVAVTITVQQRLHAMDVTGYLLSKNKVYQHICIPGELNRSINPKELADKYVDGLLDSTRLSHEILAEKREELGGKGYNAQILQNPQNDEDSIIKAGWMEVIPMSEYLARKGDTSAIIDFYLDSAYTKDTKNDPSAILACTKIAELLYILQVQQVWMEFPKLLNYIKTFTANNGYTNRSRIYVEPKASGKSIVQEMKSNTNLNIIEGAIPKAGKIERLNAISPKVEAGKVVLVQGNWNQKFIAEVTMDEPDHDDMRDTFIMAVSDKLLRSRTHGKYYIW